MTEIVPLLLALWFAVGMGWYPSCCCEECDTDCVLCANCDTPLQFKVVISGFADGQTCTTCENLDGTYFLNYQGSGCVWVTAFSPAVCFFDRVQINISGTGPYTLDVTIYQLLGSSTAYQFSKEYASKPDCTSLTDEEIPFDSNGSDNRCDGTNATVLVTAL